MSMTREQAEIAVPILNSYAHQYLGLSRSEVLVAAGHGPAGWRLIVATGGAVQGVADLDAAKTIIDGVRDKAGG